MLTGDLLRFSRRAGRVVPRLVDPGDEALRRTAAALIAAVEVHVGRRRGELEAAVDLLAPAGPRHQVERGLTKLLVDRCTFETRPGVDPAALRQAVFDRAAEAWQMKPLAELPRWRSEVLTEAGAAHVPAISPGDAEDSLYADIEENQLLTAFDPVGPERLLQRYNVSLVQGLLLRTDKLEIRARWPEPARLRQLFRWLKFFGLLFEAKRSAEDSLDLVVDGPLSVLEHGGRYGLHLAQFFSALLLWPDAWAVTAQVRVGKPSQDAELVVGPHPWLRSPLPDHGAWVPDEVRSFVSAFAAHALKQGSPWRAEAAEQIVRLPGNAYLIPDFEFVHAGTGRRVLMQHVLYPAPHRVARLLGSARLAASARQEGPPFGAYWIACRRAAGVGEDALLLTYRRTLLPSLVRERLDAETAPSPPV